MNVFEFIVQEGLIVIPVLYILGAIIKGTESIHDKWIPVILLVISIGSTPLILGGFTPDNLVQAVLIAGATVFGDQLIKQTKKGGDEYEQINHY